MGVRSLKILRFLNHIEVRLDDHSCEHCIVGWGVGRESSPGVCRVLWPPFLSSPLNTRRIGEGKTLFLARKALLAASGTGDEYKHSPDYPFIDFALFPICFDTQISVLLCFF